jgi:uncharacterized membrane protein
MTIQTTGEGTSPRTWAIVVWALYLASFITGGLTAIVGVIIAYVKRADLSGTPYESHMTSAIRTFWIILIGSIVGTILAFVMIGFVVLIALLFWALFRCIRGLIRALDGKPIEDPAGWL